MKIFSERLKFLRKQNNLTQEQVAEQIKMSLKGYRNYEIYNRTPKLENLMVIADYFDVSIDYLVGRSDEAKRR